VATAHVVDSLTAVPWLRAHGIERFLDLGSGGGLPGIPLAAALPAAGASLVESIGKKARFLDTAVAAIGLDDRVTVAARRAEALAADPAERGRWPAVTVRAVAPAAELVELAFPLLVPGGRLVAWKRGDLTAELRAAEAAIAALGGGTLDVQPVPVAALAGHVLVVVTRTGSVPDAYPRDAAQRRRRPW
jgi:16S rRNA (guanine527-N7)-methyltransferase